MKKIMKVTGFLLLLVITLNVNAQVENVSLKQFVPGTERSAKTIANDRALNKFKKLFPNAIEDSWTKTGNQFAVSFSSNNIQELVFLTKRGNFISSIRYFSESQLPPDIRKSFKYGYPDYSIKCAEEITHANVTAYLVTIEDAFTWKTIRVVNGEADIYEEHTKN